MSGIIAFVKNYERNYFFLNHISHLNPHNSIDVYIALLLTVIFPSVYITKSPVYSQADKFMISSVI